MHTAPVSRFRLEMRKRKHAATSEIEDQQEVRGPSLRDILANLSGNENAKDLCDGIRTLLSGKQAEIRKLVKPWTNLTRKDGMDTIRETLHKRCVQCYIKG